MTKDEALRLALEALGWSDEWRPQGLKEEAITAIKAALEAKDEPVALAWAEGYQMGIADERTSEANIGIAGFNAKVEPARENPYAAIPPKQDDYKALWQQMCERCNELDKKLAQQEHGWTPERIAGMARLKAQQNSRLEPQRTWVRLTDEQYLEACKMAEGGNYMVAFQRIQQWLKEKNT